MAAQFPRPPLMELPLERFIEGGTNGATPKAKPPPRPLKRPHSPASIGGRTPHLDGPESWLSPSRRRILLAEGLLSPDRPFVRPPSRRLFFTEASDEASTSSSPARRIPFSSNDAPLHPPSRMATIDPGARGFGVEEGPDMTLVTRSSSSASSSINLPITSTSKSSFSPSPHAPSSLSASPETPGLAPSPEIKPGNNSRTTYTQVKTTTTQQSSIVTPPDYNSEPASPFSYYSDPHKSSSTPISRPRQTWPSSRHHPGFEIARDSSSSIPSPSSASSSTSVEPEYDEEDKENVFIAKKRGNKRKVFGEEFGSPADVTPRRSLLSVSPGGERSVKRVRTSVFNVVTPSSKLASGSSPLREKEQKRRPTEREANEA